MSFALAIKVVATLFPGIAVALTSLRLHYRWSRGHLGCDDVWAAFAACSVFFETSGSWIRNTPTESHNHYIVSYYMLSVSFTCVLWAARMAIIASVLRIIPPFMILRRWAMAAAALLLLMWLANLCAKIAICQSDDAWKKLSNAQCILGLGIGVLELTTDVIADVILAALPLTLLWDIGMSSARRRLLMTIFSASAVTTIVSIVHAVYVFGPDRNGESLTAHLEASVSLIICNLAVLATWLLRILRRGEDIDDVHGVSTSSPEPPLTSLRFGTGGEPPIVLLTMNHETASGKGNDEPGKSTVSTVPDVFTARKGRADGSNGGGSSSSGDQMKIGVVVSPV